MNRKDLMKKLKKHYSQMTIKCLMNEMLNHPETLEILRVIMNHQTMLLVEQMFKEKIKFN